MTRPACFSGARRYLKDPEKPPQEHAHHEKPSRPCNALLWLALAPALTLSGGCSSLLPKAPPQPSFYALDVALDGAPASSTVAARIAPAFAPAMAPPLAPALAPALAPVVSRARATLVVNPPRAAAGFDSTRILYVRQVHQLEYFAHSQWVDTPTRMLAPLIVVAITQGGGFRAVVPTLGTAAGDLRLDTEVLRLQQEFDGPLSRVRFSLRATLVDASTRKVLAVRDFDASAPAPSADPYGGVVAANAAVQSVLQALASFCGAAAATAGF